MAELTYPCPICGYLSFGEIPGSYDICSICFWEDDHVQLGFPLWGTGANGLCLYEYQTIWMNERYSHRLFSHLNSRPTEADVKDAGWRPFDPELDKFLRHDDPADSARWKEHPWEQLYWWRDDYWLKGS